MAYNTALHLLRYKIDKNRELKYLNVKLTNDSRTTVPLFFGADLLSDVNIISSNHCRIHAKYAKRGLAVKLIFPAVDASILCYLKPTFCKVEGGLILSLAYAKMAHQRVLLFNIFSLQTTIEDVNIAGINNCQSGAWFYSIQGVFQLFFEFHNRHDQLKVVSSLTELWKSRQGNPKLPDKLSVTLHQFLLSNSAPQSGGDQLSQLLAKCELETPMEVGHPDAEPVVDSTSLSPGDSFPRFANDLLSRTHSFSKRCPSEERHLAASLAAFLKLAKAESNDLFASFLEVVANYGALVADPGKLRAFGSDWGIDERQNALLCLVCEWLGKNMNLFKGPIARKVEQFKAEHLATAGELPPAEHLVAEIFPECMRLLINYWIGLYGVRAAPAESPEAPHVGKKANSRADHSYSSNKEGVGSKEDVSTQPTNKRADHSYSSSASVPTTSVQSDGSPPPREDHTYVATSSQQEVEDAGSAALVPNMREDHTYVSTKERKSKGGGAEYGTKATHDHDQPNAKRFKSELVAGTSYAVMLDAGKHPFVQLILEFLNNVLISGVAHVVYTRLVHL